MPEAAVSQSAGRTLLMVYPPPGEMAVRQEVKQIETGSCDGFGGPEKAIPPATTCEEVNLLLRLH